MSNFIRRDLRKAVPRPPSLAEVTLSARYRATIGDYARQLILKVHSEPTQTISEALAVPQSHGTGQASSSAPSSVDSTGARGPPLLSPPCGREAMLVSSRSVVT